MTRKAVLLPILLLSLALFAGCAKKNEPLSATGFYFDTVITITLYDSSLGKKENDALLDACMDLAAYYENLLSAQKEGSEIWQVNHSNGAYVTVSDDTLSLLSAALSYAGLSNGLVDPSVGPLSSLWDFGSGGRKQVPADSLIRDALSHIDYTKIELTDNNVRLTDTASSLDLGFIAKGFIGDKMKQFLISNGTSSAIINLGGNVVTVGQKPDGSPFKIGIQKPFAPAGVAALTMELSDISVVSSGNYERYFIADDVLYHHILSTKTGYPVESGLSQVTILCENAVDADALSTLCFLLGYEKAAALLHENYPDVRAIFITQDGGIIYHNMSPDICREP